MPSDGSVFNAAYTLFRTGRSSGAPGGKGARHHGHSSEGITMSKFRGVLKERLNIVVTEDDARALFAMLDADNDGTMSVREFAKHLMPPDFTGASPWDHCHTYDSGLNAGAMAREAERLYAAKHLATLGLHTEADDPRGHEMHGLPKSLRGWGAERVALPQALGDEAEALSLSGGRGTSTRSRASSRTRSRSSRACRRTRSTRTRCASSRRTARAGASAATRSAATRA